jgi:Di-haem oxidoreductase, putative peroxidase
MPSFITANGPIREARFALNPDGTPDGGVHDLFSIQGRSDAPGCVFAQPNFGAAVAENNVTFRIPPPTFGDGLAEGLSDQSLQSDFAAQAQQNASLGISGHFNLSGNTGNITRFGWKAQNASMLMFAGEAYNAEEGVTNDLFPNKRNNPTTQCSIAPLPEDTVPTTVDGGSGSPASDFNSDIVNFAMFMRLLAPPTPAVPLSTSATASSGASSATPTAAASSASTTPQSTTVAIASVLPVAAGVSSNSITSAASSSSASAPSAASITAGLQAFINVGCAGCHAMNQTTKFGPDRYHREPYREQHHDQPV